MLPLAAAATLYVALVAAAVWHVLAAAGEPVYAMDDVYIHMALAKNLAAHGVYGVTPFEATHASSSPLWVLLLAAGFAVLGPWIWWPGLLAGLSALAVLAVSDRYLRQQTVATKRPAAQTARAGVLCLIVLGASLPPLTLQGMEHPLHAAVTLLAAMLGADAIAGGQRCGRGDLLLIALCLTLPVLRYESLWLTALLAAGLAWRGRYRLAAGLAIATALSICLVGFWAMSRGLTFLPAPILAKSVGPFLLSDDGLVRLVARFTWHPLTRIGRVPLLTVLFVAALIYVLARLWRLRLAALDGTSTVMAALFLAGTWAHATFATFGWGSRYEAYLIVLGLASMGGIAIDLAGRLDGASRGPRLAALLAGFAAALTIYTGFGRALETWRNAQYAAVEVLNRDIYVGRFLAAAYPRQPVLAMNIGAVVWEGEPRLLDALALGSPEALRLFLAGKLDPAALDALARQHRVRVLAVFEEWFEAWTGGRPPWIPVAQIDASNERRQLRLTLYVLEKSEGDELAAKLRTIRPSGSFTVRVRILPPYGDG
ncbi:MAG: hypothetical protein AB7O63_07930 [Reyranellaceae bacterium]